MLQALSLLLSKNIKGGIFMSNGCDDCPLKDDPNACKTMCARDHKRENDRERE